MDFNILEIFFFLNKLLTWVRIKYIKDEYYARIKFLSNPRDRVYQKPTLFL